MLGKYSKDKDKLIWKDNKSENFSMNSFDSSLESRGEVPSLKGSVGLLGAFKNGFYFFYFFFNFGGCMGKVYDLGPT